MKSLCWKACFVCSLFFTAQLGFAAPNWFGSVDIYNGPLFVKTLNVNGNTHRHCESKRLLVIATYQSLGYTTYSDSCTLLAFEIPEIYLVEQFKLPPDCIYCGPFTLEDITDKYTIDPKVVKGLMDEYRVDGFNKELTYLLEKYDMQGFEVELMGQALKQAR